MTSTRDNPRLGQSRSSLTSLGAVGGPRGTAAGALRVLIEFLTEYDPKAIQQLEGDLQQLTQLEEQLGNEQIKIADKVAKVRTQIAQREAIQRAKITDREAKKLLKQSEALRATGVPKDIKQADQLLKLALQKSNVTQREASNIRGLIRLRTQLANLEAKELAIAKSRQAVSEQQEAVEGQVLTIKGFAQQLPSKLGGLAIGAVGGLLGGALLGAGFAAVQVAIDAVGEAFLNIIDPARKAREVLDEVGSAINEIKKANEGFTDQDSVVQFLRELGIVASPELVKNLELIAQAQAAQAQNQELAKVLELNANAEKLYQEQVKERARLLQEQDRQQNKLVTTLSKTPKGIYTVIDASYYLKLAEEELAASTSRATAEMQRQSAAAAQLQRNLQATAFLAKIVAESVADSIQAASDVQTGPIDAQIEALRDSSGPSKRTQDLEAAIEKLQSGGGGGQDAARQRELANIQEERALILLRQRLRLLGTNIDLEKFEGKFLLEAIDAKIKALNKQADAQDRLNRLLDLQFRMSQTLRRQEGESIQDFLERRAQHNRDLLTEQRALEQEKIMESLREQQEKTQDEVALAELAEREKTAAVKAGTDNRLKELQKQLEASRKADRDALEAKIKALETEKKAVEKAAANAAYWATKEANFEIQEAARVARTVGQLAAIRGNISGLQAAKSFLQSLLISGVLTTGQASNIQSAIADINKSLASIGAATTNILGTLPKLPPPGAASIAFAKGGFIPLNTASRPFGNNARFGEEGTEGGMLVFPTRMYNQMKGNSGPLVENLTINKSGDPMRDQYIFKRLVRDVVREELHR